jgi:DNA-binding response OmpR family regulator
MNPSAAPTPRVVLIEDNPGDVYLVELALKSHQIDCQLVHFENGEDALKSMLETDKVHLPDLILLDLNLPRLDGKQVIQRVREHAALVTIPIAVLTSSHSPRDYDDVMKLGATRYIQKPTRLQECLNTIGGAVKELLA